MTALKTMFFILLVPGFLLGIGPSVVTGLYRYVHNPMYGGVLFIQIGTIVWYGSLVQIVCWFFLFTGLNLFIRANEKPYLGKTFGAAYAAYCRSVPRWIPGRMR